MSPPPPDDRFSRGFRETSAFKGALRALGAEVRRRRLAREWTIDSAAERTKITPKHLQKIEAGQMNVTLATIMSLCQGFEVEPSDLLATLKLSARRRSPLADAPLQGRNASEPGSTRSAAHPDTLEVIAARVSQVRLAAGLSQAALAKRAALSTSFVRQVERGSQNVSVGSLDRIAAALGTTTARLLEAHRATARPTSRPRPRVRE